MKKISRYVFQSSMGIIFGYFGLLAIINPTLEAAKWLSQTSVLLIEYVITTSVFMIILGFLQLGVATLLISDKYTKVALLIAACLLFGIIVNLGFNEISLRDFSLLAGIGYLYFSMEQENELVADLKSKFIRNGNN